MPTHLEMGDGFFRKNPTIKFDASIGKHDQKWLEESVRALFPTPGSIGTLEFKLNPSVEGEEAYRLEVAPSRIEVEASNPKGLHWSIQTLRQLQTPQGIPCLRIDDAPKFGWRGVLLDEGRHFMGGKFVRHLLDVMSLYKFNVLHWHLTEDQGWRIEIKSHPELTKVGAWRTEADGSRTGGFYTQDEIKRIVDYAASRNITIVPEIEMPGHSSAAVASYPELGCTKAQIKVPATWGVFQDVYCAGRESTFKFLEDVLTEVTALFPSRMIHIGGDEVPKTHWHDCPDCQARMKAEGLKDENELQSYFVRRIQKFLTSKGRTLMGWDEIMEGGLAKGAIVQVWRNQAFAAGAVEAGNPVVLSPEAFCYLNGPPDHLPMKRVFSYDPLEGISNPSLVKGMETTLWSERITTRNCLAMLLPRGLAMSEIFWNGAQSDFDAFEDRVHRHLAFMTAHGIDYGSEDKRIATYAVHSDPALGTCTLRANLGLGDVELRYTLDGSEPTESSKAAKDSIEWPLGQTLRVAPYRSGRIADFSAEFATVKDLALGKQVTLETQPQAKYSTAGPQALTDGILGSESFGDGQWLGWDGNDAVATVDLGGPTGFKEVGLHCLQAMQSWIMMPRSVRFEISNDAVNWQLLGEAKNDVPERTEMKQAWFTVEQDEPITARYVRVTAMNYGKLPAWHNGAGGDAYVFADEISVK